MAASVFALAALASSIGVRDPSCSNSIPVFPISISFCLFILSSLFFWSSNASGPYVSWFLGDIKPNPDPDWRFIFGL